MKLFSPHWRRSRDASLERRPEAAGQRQIMASFYGSFVRPGDLCFDVGANTGNRTTVLLDLGARVICVEPQPACVKKLKKIFGKNPAVTIVETALGEKEGQGELAICEQEPTISTMSTRWRQEGRFSGTHAWMPTVPVAVTTLDSLITHYGRPAFCKIDVEGFELAVLRGLSRPIPFISFEFTREFFMDARGCLEHLASLGPVAFNVSLGESMSLLWQDWVDKETLCENIEAQGDALLWGDIYAKFIGGEGQ